MTASRTARPTAKLTTRDWRVEFISILTVQFMAALGFAVAQPFVPLYIQELGVEGVREAAIWSGILGALGGITMAVASPIWGAIADRHGRKMMMVRATVGSAVVQTAMGFVANVHQLLVLRGIQGLVTGTVPAAMALVAGAVPATSLGFALGTLQTSVSLGNTLGPFIGGWLAAGLGYRYVFYVTGALLLVSGVICVVGVTEKVTVRARRSPQQPAWADLGAVFHMPHILTLLFVVIFCRTASNAMVLTIPLLLQEMAGGSPDISEQAGVVVGLGAVAMGIGAVVWGRLGDSIGQARVLLLCLISSAAIVLPLTAAQELWQITLGQAMYMAAVAGLLPTTSALLGILGPRGREGAIYGASGTALALGNALGPAMVAVVVGSLGTRAMFVSLAVVLLGLSWKLRSALSAIGRVVALESSQAPSISE